MAKEFKSRPKGDAGHKTYNHSRNAGVQASATSQGSAVRAESPLHLGFVPGTEGSGRIAATKRSGEYIDSTTCYHGMPLGSATEFLTQSMVAKIGWQPMLTALSDDVSRATVATAMFKYYNAIRARNASVSNFSPVDVFFALCGVSGIATLLSAIRLQLQVLSTEGSQVNGAFPQSMMAALNLSSTDRDNLAILITKYNQIISLSKGLIMPKSFRMFARQARLAGTVFLDDPQVDKSQLIVMEPDFIWHWDVDATSATVGKLIQSAVPASITARLTLALNLVSAYTLDQDMNNIYAEIRKAFESSEVYELQTFPIDGEGITLEFEQVLLDSIHNGTLIGALKQAVVVEEIGGNMVNYSGISNLDCTPITNGVSGPWSNSNGLTADNVTPHRIFAYTHDNQPSENTMADILAFKAYIQQVNTNVSVVWDCGTEVLTVCRLYFYSGTAISIEKFAAVNIALVDTTTHVKQLGLGARAWTNYSSLPVVEYVIALQADGSGNPTNFKGLVPIEGDIDNRFEVSQDAMKVIHVASFAYLIYM